MSIEVSQQQQLVPTARTVLKFAKLTENAITPTRGSKHAAGFDLYSAYTLTIPAQGKAVVKTDLQIRVPSGTYGRVAPRSGLAAKYFIDVGAGALLGEGRHNPSVDPLIWASLLQSLSATPSFVAWLEEEIREQELRFAEIEKNMEDLEPIRARWYAEFFDRISTIGFNVDGVVVHFAYFFYR